MSKKGALSNILASTECIYAASASVRKAPEWCSEYKFGRNISRIADELVRFVGDAKSKELDVFVVVLPYSYGKTVSKLAQTVNKVLRKLDELNPQNDRCFDKPVESPKWRFRFCGETLFLLSIAPCYPSTHSRYGFGSDKTFLLFQPDSAFCRRVTLGNQLINQGVRDSIRIAYAEADRIYDLEISCSPYEAYRFVKPLSLGSPPIRWWEC